MGFGAAQNAEQWMVRRYRFVVRSRWGIQDFLNAVRNNVDTIWPYIVDLQVYAIFFLPLNTMLKSQACQNPCEARTFA